MFLVLLFLIICPSVLCEYRWSTCDNTSTYTDGSTYSTNLNGVINDVSRNAPQSSGFNTSSRGQSPNKVYGLLQCIANVSAAKCSNCSTQANNMIQELCLHDKGARVWMDYCFLRYNNSNFISILDTDFNLLENKKTMIGNMQNFMSTTSSLLLNLSNKAYIAGNKLFAVGSVKYSTSTKIYGLVQCWRDISIKDCRSCLSQAKQEIEKCCSTKQGSQAMSGSCTVRYEIYPFYDSGAPSPSPEASPPSPTTLTPTSPAKPISQAKSKNSSKRLPIILGLVIGMVLVILICLIAMRKRVKSAIFRRPITLATHNQERHGFSPQSGLSQQEQNFIFSLEELAEATENFHDNNKLGEGGFGAVYKGRTKDGKQIAVKKLSAKSSQDPEKSRQLDWEKRYDIIIGIARGLLYLHEDSQMKVVHRDIKASNILLDDKLDPKIADFGLAKIFGEDESHIQSRVAGTYGYMAPEYAMRGQLSVKADVYSFGVLLLEIVSGRKNTDILSDHGMQNLLEWVWRIYKGENILSIVDSTVSETYSEEQALRCIHVGLVCVQADATLRPPMSDVIMMISATSSVTLPNPTKPAFLSSSESHSSKSRSKSSSGFDEFKKGTQSRTSGTTSSSASTLPSVNETSYSDIKAR